MIDKRADKTLEEREGGFLVLEEREGGFLVLEYMSVAVHKWSAIWIQQ